MIRILSQRIGRFGRQEPSGHRFRPSRLWPQ
jgi:hypothetical protein